MFKDIWSRYDTVITALGQPRCTVFFRAYSRARFMSSFYSFQNEWFACSAILHAFLQGKHVDFSLWSSLTLAFASFLKVKEQTNIPSVSLSSLPAKIVRLLEIPKFKYLQTMQWHAVVAHLSSMMESGLP